MKKLTAGIFTVLIGLCAANSADAAIASKAWVEQYAVSGDTYTTDKSTLVSSIADAKKAGDDAATALGAYKTENDAAVQANTNAISAINDQTTGILKQAKDYTDALANGQVTTNKNDIATLQENLQKVQGGQLTLGTDAVDSGNIKAGAVTEEKLSTELAGKVNAAQTSQQVATAITGALADYTTTADLQTNYLTKTDASTTYQTIGNMKNAISEGMTDAEKESTYPTIALLEAQIDSSAQDSAAELASVASDLSTLTQTVGANKTEAANATAAVAKDLADYETSNNAAVKALQDSIGENGATATAIAAAQADATQALADAATAQAAAEAAQEDANTNAGAITGLQTTVGDASSGLVKGVADNKAAIEAEVTRAKAAEEANATAAANAQSAAEAAQTQADKGVTDAAAAKAVADAAIPKPTADCTDLGAKCVLTVGTAGYAWELVERADNE